jgi:pimeloyl-ACP methyl ester carboxylesterase
VSSFVLVHSPLVGPATWTWVAQVLAGRGHRVTVPAGPPVGRSFTWENFADAMAAQISQEAPGIVVGHSGAGPVLPHIQARSRAKAEALVFVDAGLPPETGDAPLIPDGFRAQLEAITRDGLLPKWSAWFGPGVMEELIPDQERRTAVCGELPRLPLSYFDARVPAVKLAAAGCGYVLLSEPYAAEATQARSRGWPVRELPGTHLDIVTRPVPIADAIMSLAKQLTG